MAHRTDELDDDPVIEDLLPETIEGVAKRLLVSSTFEELVYRECELDALWTLCDIALEMVALRESGHYERPWQGIPTGDASNLVTLRAMFEEAHEFAADARTEDAARVLRDAARLCASWS